ncbi:Uncharacterised protein r2_g2589 [Pycnogonum litorale]
MTKNIIANRIVAEGPGSFILKIEPQTLVRVIYECYFRIESEIPSLHIQGGPKLPYPNIETVQSAHLPRPKQSLTRSLKDRVTNFSSQIMIIFQNFKTVDYFWGFVFLNIFLHHSPDD